MKSMGQVYILLLCCGLISARILTEDVNSDETTEKRSDIPRVRIKVFRGPNQEEHGQQYASWGFWVKQPTGN